MHYVLRWPKDCCFSCIHRLRRNIILHQPWKEISMEDLACMAPEITAVLSPLPCTVNITEDIILKRERFVVVKYCRTSDDMHVNTARMTLFSQMSRNFENIPPLPIAEVACLELISSKCAKSCKGNCNCFKTDMECTPLCKCDGTCYK